MILPLEGIRVTRNIQMMIHKNKYLSTGIAMIKEILAEGMV
ncbi:MAG: hypothetical protein ACI4SA_02250 [Lachnospiraceae bacterium]